MKLVKKLGAKQILGDVKKVVAEKCENDGDSCKVYSIFGVTNGFKTGTSQYGEWISFIGVMEAINYQTGEQFQATNCFIPEPLQSLIQNAMRESESVEFAFSVYVKRRDDTKEGYEYIVEPHKKAQESDPLAALRALVPTEPKQAALPEPEQAALPETTQANEGENEPTPEVAKETSFALHGWYSHQLVYTRYAQIVCGYRFDLHSNRGQGNVL